MQLVLSNAQSELSPLEIGIHALEAVGLGEHGKGKEGGLSEYARQIGKDGGYIRHLRLAVEVYRTVNFVSWATKLLDKAKHLAAIHSAPQDIWHLLVEAMLEGEWSKDDTEKIVKRVNDLLAAIPGWWTVDRQSILERDEPDAATFIMRCVWHLMWHVHDVDGGIPLSHPVAVTRHGKAREPTFHAGWRASLSLSITLCHSQSNYAKMAINEMQDHATIPSLFTS